MARPAIVEGRFPGYLPIIATHRQVFKMIFKDSNENQVAAVTSMEGDK